MSFLIDDEKEHVMNLAAAINLYMLHDSLLTYLRILKKSYHYWMLYLTRLSQLHLSLAVVYHLHLHQNVTLEIHVQQLQDDNNKNQIVLEAESLKADYLHWRLHLQGRLDDTRMNFVMAKEEGVAAILK